MTKTELKALVSKKCGKIYNLSETTDVLFKPWGRFTSYEFSITNEMDEIHNYLFFSSHCNSGPEFLPFTSIGYTFGCSRPCFKSEDRPTDEGVWFDQHKRAFSYHDDFTYIFSLEELIDVLEKHKYVEE